MAPVACLAGVSMTSPTVAYLLPMCEIQRWRSEEQCCGGNGAARPLGRLNGVIVGWSCFCETKSVDAGQ